MNVNDYLNRIQYFGKKVATLEVLRELCWHHVCHVPFDSISLRKGPRRIMEPESLYQTIVINKRGGLCFELNGLFHWLLKQLGFNAVVLQAQAFMDEKFSDDYGHLTIMVMFGNDRWIVDVAVLPNPINLDKCGPQEARHSLYKVELKQTSDGAYYYLDKFKRQTIAKTESSPEQMESTLKELAKQNNTKSEMANVKFGSWQHKIRFQANPDQLLNFQNMLDFHQKSPDSEFARNSFCVLHKSDGFIALWGKTLVQKHYRNHHTELLCVANLEDNENVKQVLKTFFKVKVEMEDTELHGRDLKRLL